MRPTHGESMIRGLAVLTAGMLLLSGCGRGTAVQTAETELIISAAASLSHCMAELKTAYEAEHPGVRITCNFGSSGALQQQIEQGAPADVFFSAGQKQMKALVEQDLMQGDTVADILQNRVVLIVPQDGALPESFGDLIGGAYEQIGVGEPESVPVGQYTQEIFESLGLSEPLKERLVFAKDVREVLSWVETGNVDAGIVYETDGKISDKIRIACAAPEGSHQPVVYPAGVVKGSKAMEEAARFVTFLSEKTAGEIFTKYGFTPLA